MTGLQKKQRYKEDEEYRRKCIEESKIYAQNADKIRKRRIYLSKKVYNLRLSIEVYLEKVRKRENQLINAIRELDKVKKVIKCKRK